MLGTVYIIYPLYLTASAEVRGCFVNLYIYDVFWILMIFKRERLKNEAPTLSEQDQT
jgi:peroxiredoxin family protein